ncbi:hypothetical protein PanWU01x14_244340, partial [Parasponia andersonii]
RRSFDCYLSPVGALVLASGPLMAVEKHFLMEAWSPLMSIVSVPSLDRHLKTWWRVEATPCMAWIHPLPMMTLKEDWQSIMTKSMSKHLAAAQTFKVTTPKGLTLVLSKANSG